MLEKQLYDRTPLLLQMYVGMMLRKSLFCDPVKTSLLGYID